MILAMKTILEVLQYGDFDIRFNTDINSGKNPAVITDVISKGAFAMSATLWGGKVITSSPGIMPSDKRS